MDDIRVGLAGLGHRGLHWLRLLQRIEGYRVTALFDPIAALHEPALATLEDSSGVNLYTAYEDMLDDRGVDAVALCVRSFDQGALAAQALEAGKHVSSEVPLAYRMEDCWRIASATERSGLVYLLAEQVRYGGIIEAWRDLVQEGRLGRITYCEGQYFGYKTPRLYYQDQESGEFVFADELPSHPKATPTTRNSDPIYYLPHELSPLLKILDDRVVEVVAMSTGSPGYSHPEVGRRDVQAALMKTEKDTILRLMCGFTQPTPPERDHHWFQIIGTRGSVESGRTSRDLPKLWLADAQMHDMAEVDWRSERIDAPEEARGSGHRDTDFYVHTAFRDAVLGTRPLEFDVYRAIETAAPAILAAESIANGSKPMRVPDFRPSASRPSGQMPQPS